MDEVLFVHCTVIHVVLYVHCIINYEYYLVKSSVFLIPCFQWILDALICNGLGIYFGIKTCDYLAMKVCSASTPPFGDM